MRDSDINHIPAVIFFAGLDFEKIVIIGQPYSLKTIRKPGNKI